MSNTTKFYVGGCSGSSSPEFSRGEFGTLTTSFGLSFGKTGVFIDNGSGVSKVASYLLGERVSEVYGFQTHFHGDHRHGIHGNKLLFVPGLVKGIHAPKLCRRSFKRLFELDFSEETWPISPNDITIESFYPGEETKTPFPVRTMRQNHPGGSVAYRITTPAGDVVVATDTELVGKHMTRFAHFASGCALLYIDVQYRTAEYEGLLPVCGGRTMSRVGWGHSTPDMLFEAIRRMACAPKRILVGHHDPARDLGDLFVFEQEIKNQLIAFPSQVEFAREGKVIEV
jgi:phosphoribosyl 1,2-cyclic phosphodiesterase